MAGSVEALVKQLTDSSVIAPGNLENFIPPKAQPKDADALIAELVRQNHLTPFQAAQIKAGKAKALVLGEYTILDRIGAGGMGQVFRAVHRRMDRTVAIKMLPASTMKDAATVARFEREVRAAAKLSHPNIVAAYDAGQAGAAHFLVMEFVDGRDLSATVKQNGPLPVAKALEYVRQAACGLAFAHSEGVIHRDIKPANLLLDKKGTVKILDMGLARIDSPGGAQAELTGTGAVMGTVDYMAPEQALNTKHADARADIYSLGCSLYYLIAGTPIYGGETVVEKIFAHTQQPIPDLKTAQPNIPDQLDAVFRRMVAKKADDRYQTMSEVVADLERCQGAIAAAASSATGIWQPPGASSPSGTIKESDVSIAMGHSPLRKIYGDEDRTMTAAVTHAGEPGVSTPRSQGNKSRGSLMMIVGGAAALALIALGVWVIVGKQSSYELTRVSPADPERAAVEWVHSHGGFINYLDDLGKGHALAETQPLPTGRIRLTYVNFQGRQFAGLDEGLKQLVGLKELDRLFLDKTNVSDAGLRHLESIPTLIHVKLKETRVTAAGVAALQKALPECKIEWDDPSKPTKPWETPEFQKWVADTQKLPAEQQIEAVSKKLMELNPGFDGKLTGFEGKGSPKVEKGVVTELEFITDTVTDISPVRALAALRKFNCYGSVSKIGILSDLSPLQGMKIVHLGCLRNKVSNLLPLKGMPLTIFGCGSTDVSDLSPLKGMSLGIVDFGGTNVSDLSPLHGMPLKQLTFNRAQVADLSPLEDCKSLESLSCLRTKVTPAQVAALQKALPNCKIEWDDPQVVVDRNRKAAEWILSNRAKGWSLQIVLKNGPQNVDDAQHLPGEPFVVNSVGMHQQATDDDLLALSDCTAITSLYVDGAPITDRGVSQLQGLTLLLRLNLWGTKITDAGVAHLRGLSRLEVLSLGATSVGDQGLAHLHQLKNLKELYLKQTSVTAAGVAALQKALPNCKIEWDGDTKVEETKK